MARRRKTRRKKVVRRPKVSNLNYPVPDDQIDLQFEFDGARGDWHDEMEWELCGAPPLPDKYRFDRSEYPDRIRELEKAKASSDFYNTRHSHQGRSHECVHHAATNIFICAFNRQYGGTKYELWFSPVYGYTIATGGRQYGGSNVQHSLRIMMETGCLPEHDGPKGPNSQHKLFKYTLHQTSGRTESHWPTNGWIRPGNFEQPEAKDTSRHFRVLEAYYIPDREAHASALLNPEFSGVVNGRDGHSIWHCNMVLRDGSPLSRYKDSYKVYRFDSMRKWGGGYTIRSVTRPDDPTKPAGEDMK